MFIMGAQKGSFYRSNRLVVKRSVSQYRPMPTFFSCHLRRQYGL